MVHPRSIVKRRQAPSAILAVHETPIRTEMPNRPKSGSPVAPSPAAAHDDPIASPWRANRERLRDREVKREAVIRAAAHAFNRKGYHNTSLDDIAAALEVTKPTVYYYVSNKEQLLFECFVAGIERIRAAFREARALAAPGRERLKAVLRRYGEAMASEFGWCMVRAEDQDLSPDMSAHIKAMKSEIDQGIRRLLREGIQDGSIHPCDPKMTAFALAGALNWIAHWYRESQGMTGAEIAEAFISVFECGLAPRAHSSNEDPTCRKPKSSSSRPGAPRSARSRAPSRR
jgi:AcrR family transcriptional regulator